jgi:hypothetical protein
MTQENQQSIETDFSKVTKEDGGGFFETRDGRFAKKVFIRIVLALVVTSLLGFVSNVKEYYFLDFFKVAIFLWYPIMGIAFLFFLYFLGKSSSLFGNKDKRFALFTLLFLVVVGLVGFGTCLVNMMNMM